MHRLGEPPLGCRACLLLSKATNGVDHLLISSFGRPVPIDLPVDKEKCLMLHAYCRSGVLVYRRSVSILPKANVIFTDASFHDEPIVLYESLIDVVRLVGRRVLVVIHFVGAIFAVL